jgi:hypothetical protein
MKSSALLKIMAICLVPGVLSAQSITQSTTQRTMVALSDVTMDMKGFFRRIANNLPATLVLFDTSEKEWEQEFERIRREDPFAILNLRFIPLAIHQGLGSEFREREGWPEAKPRWAIFNPKGQIVANGGILPTSAQLADECSSAKILSKVEILRRFLREHPNHEEGREALLQEMLTIAGIRTRNALLVPEFRTTSMPRVFTEIDGVMTNEPSDGEPTAQQIESLPQLTPDVDERIWRDYCIELQRYLEGVVWQSGGIAPSGPLIIGTATPVASAWAVFSPITKVAYAKAASTVEAALSRQPSSSALWRLWLTLHKTGAGKPMKELLSGLEPSPSVAPADWPPASIRTAYLKVCREAGDWKAIQELVEPIWNSINSRLANIDVSRVISSAMTEARLEPSNNSLNMGNINGMSQGFWISNGEPYLEALLRMQRLSEAEQMMKAWADGSGWPGAFLAAAAIADRLGFESTAKTWREMGNKQ